MSNSIAPGSSADVNVRVTALTTNPNVPVTYKTIILKKNLVNGVNTLTQEMMSATNTKYVIKYDYTLATDIIVPANCILEFDGGSISGDLIHSTQTKVINLPENTNIIGKIYNTNSEEITIKGDVIKRNTTLLYPILPITNNNQFMVNGVPKQITIARSIGITDCVLCLSVKFDSKWKFNDDNGNYYTDISDIINFCKKYNLSINSIKFQPTNISEITYDNFVVSDYVNFVNDAVSTFKDEIDFTNVYITNETPLWVNNDHPMLSGLVLLSSYIKTLGFTPRISFENWDSLRIYARTELYDSVIPSINWYPTMSYDDENTVYSEDIVNEVFKEVEYNKYYWNNHIKLSDIVISECGTTIGKKALRYPYEWRESVVGPFAYPEIAAIFYKVIVTGLNRISINSICIWFIEQYGDKSLQDYLYNLFVKQLK